jgi:hypothetical protein
LLVATLPTIAFNMVSAWRADYFFLHGNSVVNLLVRRIVSNTGLV